MRFQEILRFAAAASIAFAVMASPLPMLAQGSDTVLKPADCQKLLPAAVYYKAQSAPTQLRNSSGIKFTDGYYLLSTLVDTSGYSSDVASKYQAYFITEVPIKIGGQSLPAGIYGVGFIAGDNSPRLPFHRDSAAAKQLSEFLCRRTAEYMAEATKR